MIFQKDKLNKNEYVPVHLRIIKDRKINYRSTGEMFAENFET